LGDEIWSRLEKKGRLKIINFCRAKGVTADQEESLLQQLTEITRVMQEGQLVEGIAAEKRTQEDWDGMGKLSTCHG